MTTFAGTPSHASEEVDVTSVVQAQLEAYNAHDIRAFLATYASEAEIYEYPARLLMKGAAQIEDDYAHQRFNDTRLHASIVQRFVMENLVVDHERVEITFAEGPGRLESIVVYEVRDGRIQRVTLMRGRKILDPAQ